MDIYFTPEWGEVNQLIEEGEPKMFRVECQYGIIQYLFMLREIPWKVDGKQYYDIRFPYGYGGPYIVECKENCKQLLLDEFDKEFREYCLEQNIVSEFVRFHPIEKNADDFADLYYPQYMRHTVGTDLAADDPIQAEFSKGSRKYIRRALKAGVNWEVEENPQNVDDFVRVYYSTMERDKATDFYYFPEEYFEKCLELFGKHVILVKATYDNKVIAAGFYITSGTTIHAHLSGTLNEYLYLSPAYVIKYATAVWGKEHSYKLIHYGGGTSDDPEDSLLQYKLKFTKSTIFNFYIGKVVRNQEVYDSLCCKKGVKIGGSSYFPNYRKGGGYKLVFLTYTSLRENTRRCAA